MKDVFIVMAMSRSGHHAVMNWICNQYGQGIRFHNNCVKGWDENKLIARSGKIIDYHSSVGNSSHMYSFEDFDMDDFSFIKNSEPFQNADRRFCIIVVRDLYNLVASCLKAYEKTCIKYTSGIVNERGVKKENNVALWCKQVKECLRETKIVDESVFVDINYNTWFENKDYRKGMCNKLDLKFTDDGLNYVPKFGNASSFDKQSKQGNAQDMNVTERYKSFVNNSKFIEIINQKKEEVIRLNNKYFNMEWVLSE